MKKKNPNLVHEAFAFILILHTNLMQIVDSVSDVKKKRKKSYHLILLSFIKKILYHFVELCFRFYSFEIS